MRQGLARSKAPSTKREFNLHNGKIDCRKTGLEGHWSRLISPVRFSESKWQSGWLSFSRLLRSMMRVPAAKIRRPLAAGQVGWSPGGRSTGFTTLYPRVQPTLRHGRARAPKLRLRLANLGPLGRPTSDARFAASPTGFYFRRFLPPMHVSWNDG